MRSRMPTRSQTIIDAVRIFENAIYPPSGLTKTTAWLGIYQTLLWYEPVSGSALPHIIDSDKLRPASGRDAWVKPKIWQQRAKRIEDYIAASLGCPSHEVESKVDLLTKTPGYRGMQRQNTLGIAFAGLIKHVLEKFGSSSVSYEVEVLAASIFPDTPLPGRSAVPRLDVLAHREGIPRAIISAKHSVRHDRVNDVTSECPTYKQAFNLVYASQSDAPMKFYVVTNEYDPARLSKMIEDSCIDGVVHVHKEAVTKICGLNGRLEELIDLDDFVAYMSL